MIVTTFAFVYFAMPPQVGDNREMAAASVNFARESW
jgi:hypothetical protein